MKNNTPQPPKQPYRIRLTVEIDSPFDLDDDQRAILMACACDSVRDSHALMVADYTHVVGQIEVKKRLHPV